MSLKSIGSMFREAGQAWSDDGCSRLGAAIAYYSIFSMAPLLVIAIAVGGMVFGEEAAQGLLVGHIAEVVGRAQAEFIESAIRSAAANGRTGAIATIVGFLTLLLGASGVFSALQDALNTIWHVPSPPGRAVWHFFRNRFWAFTLVLATGFLLLMTLATTTLLQAVHAVDWLRDLWIGTGLPGALYIWRLGNLGISFCFIVVFFAMIYRFLPAARIPWIDVILGAIVAGVLYTGGKYVLGLYLGSSNVTSSYGFASSLVFLLMWVYYSSQILLFGAEFARVCARRRGDHIASTQPAR